MDYFFNFEKIAYLKGERPPGCILCLVNEGAEGVVDLTVYREKLFAVTVNLYPYNPGHVMVFPTRHVEDIRELTADEELALLGCGVTTGLGAALNTAGVTPGSTAAVIGCGGVGQSVVQGARIAGAAVIVAVDPLATRRESVLAVGATHAFDPETADVVGEVRALTGGRGADFTFEVVGRSELVVQAFDMARRGGTVTMVGMPPMDDVLSLPLFPTVFSAKRLVGSVVGDAQILRDFPRFIALAESGRLDLGAMVSRRIALDEINDGLAALEHVEGVRTVVVEGAAP